MVAVKIQNQEAELKLETNRDVQMMIDTTPSLSLMDLIEPSEAEIQACIAPIAANCMKCVEAAKVNGIRTRER